MSRRLQAILFLIPIAALMVVFRELLLGRFFFNDDVLLANLPFLFYRGRSVALLAQGMLSGFPLFVTVNASWFYPVTTFLFTHLSANTAYIALDIGNIVLTYILTYTYARKMQLSAHASVLAAMVFMFSGQLMLWAQSIIMTAYYFLLPASLYLFEVALESRGWQRAVILMLSGVLLGSGWLSSQVQFLVYIHAFYFVYVVFRLWKKEGWLQTASIALLVPYIASLLVGLPMIKAVLSFQSETLRANGVTLVQAVGAGYMPWDFLHYILPFWGVSFLPMASANLYIGIAPLILLLLSIAWYTNLSHPLKSLYMWTLAFCLLASVRYSPIAVLLHYVPFWNAFRENPRVMFIGGFAAAMLVGMALDYCIAHWNDQHLFNTKTIYFVRITILYLCIPLFALVSLVRWLYFGAIESRLDAYFLAHSYAHTTGLPQVHYLAVIRQYLHQALDQISFFDVQAVMFVVFSLVLIFVLRNKKYFSVVQFVWIIVSVTAINFAAVYINYYPTVTRAAVFDAPNSVNVVAAKEEGHTSPWRVFSVLPAMTIYNDSVDCPLSPEDTVQLQKELLEVNGNLLYGVDSVEGYENFMPRLASEAVNYIGSESTGAQDPLFLAHISWDEKVRIILSRVPVLRAMNVKYVTSGVELTDPRLELINTSYVGSCRHPAYLYALEQTWPRYFLTNKMYTFPDQSDASTTLSAVGTYDKPVVLLATSTISTISRVPFVTEVTPAYTEREMRFGNLTCATSCALFVGNTYLSHWNAELDGKPISIIRANYQYMAVLLPRGLHTVDFTYQP